MKISIFAESIKRLYMDEKVDKEKVVNLCKNGKLTEDEKNYILEAR